MKRVLTALVLIPVTLAAVLWASDVVFALLVLIVALLAVREYYDLASAAGFEPYRYVGYAATAAIVMRVAVAWAAGVPSFQAVVIAALLAVLVRALANTARIGQAIPDSAVTLFGLFYPGLLVALIGAIRTYPGGYIWLLFLMIVVWSGDIAALYAGKLLGKHPLAPLVSPKKTWEGAIASCLAAFLIGGGLGVWMQLGASASIPHNLFEMGALAIALNIAAQAGDLIESLFKRSAQVKDSGTLLPGHGGVLDRVDALIFAAPLLWYYLSFHV